MGGEAWGQHGTAGNTPNVSKDSQMDTQCIWSTYKPKILQQHVDSDPISM